MYKHLFRAVLGVVGIFGILSLGVVDAKSETIYITGTDGTIIQTNNQEWEDIELYLINYSTQRHYTLMDRNLGASIVGSGVDVDSYGYYYQRGNNYGFQLSGSSISGAIISNEKVNTTGFGPGRYYASNKFIAGNGNWSLNNNENLWGGSGDTINSDGISTTLEDRKGPCPYGYHIPTLYDADYESLFYTRPGSKPKFEVFMPYAGSIDGDCMCNRYVDYGYAGYYLSSPYGYLEWGRDMRGSVALSAVSWSGTVALPIRCYKNVPNNKIKVVSDGDKGRFNISIYKNKIISFNGDIGKTNATFYGRFGNEEFTGKQIETGDDVSELSGIYAKFVCNTGYEENEFHNCAPINYSIFYELDGGTGNNVSGYSISTNTFSLNSPIKTGYKFLGWTGDNGNVPQIYVSILKGSTGDKKYYANWEKYPWYTYDANGGIFKHDGSEKLIKYRNIDQDFILNTKTERYINIPFINNLHVSLSGKITWDWRLFIFTGCFTGYINYGDDISGYIYKLDKDSDAHLDFDITGDITFVSVPSWGYNSYEISIFANYVPFKTGYSFAGWYEEGADNEFDITQPAVEDKLLYAHRIPNQYTITFDTNGGTNIPSITADYGTGITAPANPTKNGYTFKGRDKEIPSTMPAGNITIKSIWEKNGSSGGGGGGGGGGSSSSNTGSASLGTGNQINSNTGDIASTGTNIKEPETNTGSNTQTGSQVNSPEQTPQNDESNAQDSTTSSQNDGKRYSTEFQEAYEFAKGNGITTMPTIQKANMEGKLTRIAMAKMLSQYAINVLGKTPDTTQNNKFNDVTDKQNSDYDDGVTLAYQLGIMGQNMPGNNFRPNDEVTRAEFATALSRMAYGTSDGEYKGTGKYYIHHMEKLVKEGIITKDDPNMKELRGYVMIMLMRSTK